MGEGADDGEKVPYRHPPPLSDEAIAQYQEQCKTLMSDEINQEERVLT